MTTVTTTVSTPLTLHRYRVKLHCYPVDVEKSLVRDDTYIRGSPDNVIFEGFFDFNPTVSPPKLHAIHDSYPSDAPDTYIPHPETDSSGVVHMSTFNILTEIINKIAEKESKPAPVATFFRLSGASYPNDFQFVRDPIEGNGFGGWVEAFTGEPSSIGFISILYDFIREGDIETTIEVVTEKELVRENDPVVDEVQKDITTVEKVRDDPSYVVPDDPYVVPDDPYVVPDDPYVVPDDPVTLIRTPIVPTTIPTDTEDPYTDYMIADPCFPANTPITTDQGTIAIQNIVPNRHTINGNAIRHVTKTISTDDYLVCFKPHSLAVNVPSKKTLISPHHKIYFGGKMLDAHRFVGMKGVEAVAYSGEILYNILEDNYSLMKVNNIVCETLDPTNVVARLYNSNLGEEYKKKIISAANHTTKKRNIRAYSSVVNKL